jgi:tetratricopeptide (TPR) repeat protein
MIKPALAVAALALVSAASAQNPDPKRLEVIWDSVYDRLSRQTDAWFKDGDFPRTVQILRFHYSLDTTSFENGTNLGYMLENIELNDEALAVYIRLRTTNPNDPDDAWPEANFYFRKKAYAKVPPILEPTIKGHDPHPNNYRTLAHAYEKLNMFADAKRVWEKYLAKHPNDLAAKANLNKVIKKLSGGGKT